MVPTTNHDGSVSGVSRPPADGGISTPVVGPVGMAAARVPSDQGSFGGRPGRVPPAPLTPNNRPLRPSPDRVVVSGLGPPASHRTDEANHGRVRYRSRSAEVVLPFSGVVALYN